MSRENTYNAIILKKSPYGEGDEIVTVFTQEAGKLRALAKSSKFSKSKLQFALQSLFLVSLSLSGGKLPKIIGAEVKESFAHIREDLAASNASFYVLELVLKFTPDEQKNSKLFNLLRWFLAFINNKEQERLLPFGLLKFKIEFLKSLGLGIETPQLPKNVESVGFSPHTGRFLFDEDSIDYQEVGPEAYKIFAAVNNLSLDETAVPDTFSSADLSKLQDITSSFLHYHLEREIKSERFLDI